MPKYSADCPHCPHSQSNFFATYKVTKDWEPQSLAQMKKHLAKVLWIHLTTLKHYDESNPPKEIPPPAHESDCEAWVNVI